MRRSKIIAILSAVVVVAGACSSGGSGSALLGALGKVRATDSTRQWIEYGDLAALRSLRDANRDRFLSLTGSGMSNIARYDKTVAENLAFDPLSMRTAVTAGAPPNWSGIIWGFYDVAAVNDKFAALGIERTGDLGGTTWSASPDGTIRIDSPLVETAGPATLNNVRTAPGSFAFSPKRDTLALVTDPGSDTLADDPTIRSMAHCLGDVVAAVISRARGPETLAVGVRAPSATDVTEVICVAPATRDPAALRDHARSELQTGRSALSGRPWSELLPDATVQVTGLPPAVQILAKPAPDAPAGRSIQMLLAADLDALLDLR
ncbi:MAG TPA: hypothetical protein VGX25_00855 [Actinophytocola sp.]|uniref:hypothetical protein n=1 Tax=Actinophytocola sp. TaxID=1872138 RepID=UPI002DDD8D6C|nr:hypothetical protein [Actinophytocola sp.]HEV2777925.1 hypothetical protein [Actinophytocola sp.]